MILFALLYYIFSLKNKTKLQIQNTFVVIFPPNHNLHDYKNTSQ